MTFVITVIVIGIIVIAVVGITSVARNKAGRNPRTRIDNSSSRPIDPNNQAHATDPMNIAGLAVGAIIMNEILEPSHNERQESGDSSSDSSDSEPDSADEGSSYDSGNDGGFDGGFDGGGSDF